MKEHENKYLLVFQEKIVGSFDSYEKAAEEGVRYPFFSKQWGE